MVRLNLPAKLSVLRQLYEIYDNFTQSLNLSCHKGCAHCCSRNVTMTSLEAMKLADTIRTNQQFELLDRVKNQADEERFIPEVTSNGIVQLCLKDLDLPEEKTVSGDAKCPLLIENECSVYDDRPFECRSLISSKPCEEHGYAQQDPYYVTVNTVFKQYIEHVDAGGVFGNLTDVLLHVQAGENDDKAGSTKGLIKNQIIEVLMIPPEHQAKIQGLIKQIQAVKV